MPDLQRRPVNVTLIALLAVALLIGVVAVIVMTGESSLPDGPVEILYDREVCAQCQMHIGEPAFAAQLQTVDGKVLAFDDPGCLFLYERDYAPNEHAVYFRHVDEPRWVARESAAFKLVEPTPMGFGIGAVDMGTPDTITVKEARNRSLAIWQRLVGDHLPQAPGSSSVPQNPDAASHHDQTEE